jgi:hypothetical protein
MYRIIALVGDVGLDSHWPVELASRLADLEELFFHLRAKGNEIQSN